MSARVTVPVGSKVVAVRPGMMFLAASVLMACTRFSACVVEVGEAHVHAFAEVYFGGDAAMRVRNSAICERVTCAAMP